MPPRQWRLRIQDMLAAIARIQGYVEGMSFEDFANDPKTLDAVVRNFEVLGEAARRVPTEVQARFPGIPWIEMHETRNVVAHAYFRVDPLIIWDAIHRNLPPLVPALERILDAES